MGQTVCIRIGMIYGGTKVFYLTGKGEEVPSLFGLYFLEKGRTLLAIVKGKQNAEKYIKTLEDYLLPLINGKHPFVCVFQQDNTPIHTPNVT